MSVSMSVSMFSLILFDFRGVVIYYWEWCFCEYSQFIGSYLGMFLNRLRKKRCALSTQRTSMCLCVRVCKYKNDTKQQRPKRKTDSKLMCAFVSFFYCFLLFALYIYENVCRRTVLFFFLDFISFSNNKWCSLFSFIIQVKEIFKKIV